MSGGRPSRFGPAAVLDLSDEARECTTQPAADFWRDAWHALRVVLMFLAACGAIYSVVTWPAQIAVGLLVILFGAATFVEVLRGGPLGS